MWFLSFIFVLAFCQAVTTACSKRESGTVKVSVDDYWQKVKGQENVEKLNETTFHSFIQQRSWVFYYNTWCPTFKSLRNSVAKIATFMRENKYPGGLGAFECLGLSNDKPICMEAEKSCRNMYNLYYYAGKFVESYPYDPERDEERVVNYFMRRHISMPDRKVFPESKC